MTTTLLSWRRNIQSPAASTSVLLPAGAGPAGAGTGPEALEQVTYRTAGTLSNATLQVRANNRGASTFRSRINAAYGNQTVAIGASATGLFEDTTNTDVIVSGDKVCFEWLTGAGGTSSQFTGCDVHFTPTNSLLTVTRFMAKSPAAYTLNVLRVGPIVARTSATSGTEPAVQSEMQAAGTLTNLFAYVSANTYTQTVTVRSRKNGANGNLLVSIPTTATGIFEDLTNSDTLVIGDLVNYGITGAGTGSCTFESMASTFTTTDATWTTTTSENGTFSNAGVAVAAPLFGQTGAGNNASEAQMNSRLRFACLWSRLRVTIGTNSAGGATITARKNGADTALTVSAATGLTGIFEDLTHTVALAAGDLVNFMVVGAGVGTGTLILSRIDSRMANTQGVAPIGVVSAEANGAPGLAPGVVTVAPGGAASSEADGAPTLSRGAVIVAPAGVASSEITGEPSVTPGAVTIVVVGVPSAEADGTPTLTHVIGVIGVASGEAAGTPTFTPGAVFILPAGVPSDEIAGVLIRILNRLLNVEIGAGVGSGRYEIQ